MVLIIKILLKTNIKKTLKYMEISLFSNGQQNRCYRMKTDFNTVSTVLVRFAVVYTPYTRPVSPIYAYYFLK